MNIELAVWVTPLTISIIGWFISRTLYRIETDLREMNESIASHSIRLAVVEATKMPADPACYGCEKRGPLIGRRISDGVPS